MVFSACVSLAVVLLSAFAANLRTVFPRQPKAPSLKPGPMLNAGIFSATNPMALHRGSAMVLGSPGSPHVLGPLPFSLSSASASVGLQVLEAPVVEGPRVIREALRTVAGDALVPGSRRALPPSLFLAQVRRRDGHQRGAHMRGLD
jgi:hypothetical protein